MELGTSASSVTNVGSESSAIMSPSNKLDRTYFDNPAWSDLTIVLRDRSVYVHRVVLCRESEYFYNLLDERAQAHSSNELTFPDDDPELMMIVLRHLYGLPYASDPVPGLDRTTLLPHALVYAAAVKYEIEGLRKKSYSLRNEIMFHCCASKKTEEEGVKWLVSPDQLRALHVIISSTPAGDTQCRNLLVSHCVEHLGDLQEDTAFMQLVAEVPGLGADLIRHLYNGEDDEDDGLADLDYSYESDAGEEYCVKCEKQMPMVCSQCKHPAGCKVEAMEE